MSGTTRAFPDVCEIIKRSEKFMHSIFEIVESLIIDHISYHHVIYICQMCFNYAQ